MKKSELFHIRPTQIALVVLAICLLPATAWSDIPSLMEAKGLIIELDTETPFMKRESGEVQVLLGKTFVPEAGYPFRVTASFADRADYFAAMSLGAHRVDLAQLQHVMFRGASGNIEWTAFQGAKSVWQLLDQANGNLCGTSVARAFVELAPDLWMGISFHAGGIKSSIVVLPREVDEEDPKPVDEFQCSNDVFDNCDLFAIGGCGGPKCTNSYKSGNKPPYSVTGECKAIEIPWAPDTCYCTAFG